MNERQLRAVAARQGMPQAPYLCGQFDAFVTAEEAEKRRAELERLNPGRRFAVVPV